MSVTDSTAVELSDPELITRVRAGDVDAFGDLFARHRDAATRLARVLTSSSDADDLVSEAFVKVLNVLLAGGGPDVAFRAYVLTAVRRLHVDRIRSTRRVTPTDDMEAHDAGVPFTDTAVNAFEGGAAAKAFASLPERWQLVLWHLEVENQKPADVAPLLGMSANSVSALAYRAREGLRQAFLTMHAAEITDSECVRTRELLGGYVRSALSRRDSAHVRDHLEGCRRCTATYLELDQVNSSLAALLGPVVLGGAAAAYVGSGVVAGGGAIALVAAGADRAKDFVANNVALAGAAAAAVVAAAVAGAFAFSGGPPPQSQADAPRPAPGAASPSVSAPAATPAETRPEPAAQAKGAAKTTPAPQPAAARLPVPTLEVAATTAPLSQPRDATPKSAPKPAPKPAPATSKPKPAPSSEQPKQTRVDVSVSVSVGPAVHGRVRLDVRVSGVPGGRRAQLTVTAAHGSLTALSAPGCSPTGRGMECVVGSGRVGYSFGAQSGPGSELTARVSTPAGLTETLLGNNWARVRTPAP